MLRYFPITSLRWMDEIVELCIAGLVFYGSAAVWMTKGHFSIGDWISKFIKNIKAKRLYRYSVLLLSQDHPENPGVDLCV